MYHRAQREELFDVTIVDLPESVASKAAFLREVELHLVSGFDLEAVNEAYHNISDIPFASTVEEAVEDLLSWIEFVDRATYALTVVEGGKHEDAEYLLLNPSWATRQRFYDEEEIPL